MLYTFTVTQQELDYIGAVLGEQPHKTVHQLIAKLKEQAKQQEQNKPTLPDPV